MTHPASPATDITRAPIHPGLIVADAIAALGVPKMRIAEMIGISRQTLHDILAGRAPITPTVAVKLGKLLGNGARIWVVMQADYDTWQAEQKVDVTGIETLTLAA